MSPSSAIVSRTATPAAHATGLPPYVEPCEPVPHRAWSSRRAASASLYEFVKQAWHVLEPGVPFVPGWHIEAICEHLEACCDGYIPNLLINVPPRFSKSTICGVMFPAWVWAQRNVSSLSGPGAQFLHAGTDGAPPPDKAWHDVGGHVRGFEERFDPAGFHVPAERIQALAPLFQWVLHAGREAFRTARCGSTAS